MERVYEVDEGLRVKGSVENSGYGHNVLILPVETKQSCPAVADLPPGCFEKTQRCCGTQGTPGSLSGPLHIDLVRRYRGPDWNGPWEELSVLLKLLRTSKSDYPELRSYVELFCPLRS